MSAFVDYGKIRAGVDIESVLAHYGIATRKVSNSQLKSDCPLASHKSAAHEKGTFSISLAKGKWYCHSDSCRAASGMPKGGDCIDLVRLLDGCTVVDAAKKLVEWYPHLNQNAPHEAERNGGRLNNSTAVVPNSTPSPLQSKSNPPLAFQLGNVIPTHKMIQSRGISPATAESYGCGFFGGKGMHHNRIVFRLVENGEVIGYSGRATEEGQQPKWLLPKGLVKSFLYGLEKCTPEQPLILAESFWAPLWFREQHTQAAALMGKELTEAQEACLSPFKTIIVALDNDQPGHEAAAKIVARLRELGHKALKATLLE